MFGVALMTVARTGATSGGYGDADALMLYVWQTRQLHCGQRTAVASSGQLVLGSAAAEAMFSKGGHQHRIGRLPAHLTLDTATPTSSYGRGRSAGRRSSCVDEPLTSGVHRRLCVSAPAVQTDRTSRYT